MSLHTQREEEEKEIDFSKNKPNSEKVLAGFNKMREGIENLEEDY